MSDASALILRGSHPGVEKILAAAAKIDPRIYMVAGGFHLVLTSQSKVQRTADVLYESLEVEGAAQ